MALSRERVLNALARLPFTDEGKLALILGEPPATVRPTLAATYRPIPVSGGGARSNRVIRDRFAGSRIPGGIPPVRPWRRGNAAYAGCVGGGHVIHADTALFARSLDRGAKLPPAAISWGRQEAATCHLPGFQVGNCLLFPLSSQELYFYNSEIPR